MRLHGLRNGNIHVAVAVGHKMYCFGQLNSYSDTRRGYSIFEVHVFNTVSLRWTTVPRRREEQLKLLFSRPFGFTALLIENIIYIWGGYPYGNQLYAFDVETHAWFKPRVSGTVPESRYNHSACALGKDMLIYGGSNVSTEHINRLDSNAMVWSIINTRGTAPPNTMGHSATIIGTTMFVFGGIECCNNISMFDTETNFWLSCMPSAQLLPRPRWNHLAFAYSGELYILGGDTDLGRMLYDLWKFNPETFSWYKVKPEGGDVSPEYAGTHHCCLVGDCIVFFTFGLHVLDLNPGLKTLCKRAVLQYGLEWSELPHDIRWELTTMTTDTLKINNRSVFRAFKRMLKLFKMRRR